MSCLDRKAIIICDVKENKTHQLTEVALRFMLRNQVDSDDELGFTAKASSQMEYFIFKYSFYDAAENGYKELKPAPMFESNFYQAD